jgi:8-oxo-dGTP diphosphatase
MRYSKILMVKQQKHGRIFWNFPGGHIEEGETPEEACIREVKEETGFEIKINRLLINEDNKFIYEAEIVSGEMSKEEGLIDLAWVSIGDTEIFDHKTGPVINLLQFNLPRMSQSD